VHEVQQTAELKQYAMMVGDGMGFLSVVADGVEAGWTDAGDEGLAVVAVEVGEGSLDEFALLQGHEAGEPLGFVDVEAMGATAFAAGDGDSDLVDVGGVWFVGAEFAEHVGFQWGERESPLYRTEGYRGPETDAGELVGGGGWTGQRTGKGGVSVGDFGEVLEVVHTNVLLHVGVWWDEGDGFEEDAGLEVLEEVGVGEVVGVGKVDIPTGETVDDRGEVGGGGVDADHLEHLPIVGLGGVEVDGHAGFPPLAIVEGGVIGDALLAVGGEVCEHEKSVVGRCHWLCLRMVWWVGVVAPCKQRNRGERKAPCYGEAARGGG